MLMCRKRVIEQEYILNIAVAKDAALPPKAPPHHRGHNPVAESCPGLSVRGALTHLSRFSAMAAQALPMRPISWKAASPQKQAPAARTPQVARGSTTDLPDQPRGVPVAAVPPLPAAWQQVRLAVPPRAHSFASPRPPLLPLALAPL